MALGLTINAEKVSTWLNEVLSNYDSVNGTSITAAEDGVRIVIETASRNDVYTLGREYLNEEADDLSEQLESARREASELRKNLSTQIPSAMLKQCDEILSIPAESHCITLNFSYDRVPSMDYSVDGILFNEEMSE